MRRISILALFTFFALSVSAQSGLHLGVHSGLNVVGIINPQNYGAPEYDYKPKTGFLVGGVVGFDFLKYLGVQAELNYMKTGHRAEEAGPGGEELFREIKFDYLQIPLLAKLRSGGDVVKFYLLFGPQFNFLQNASIASSESAENVEDAITNGNFKRNDTGLLLGTGADIFVTESIYINLGLRFYYGLTDINTDSETFWQNRVKADNPSTNAFAGVNLGLHYSF